MGFLVERLFKNWKTTSIGLLLLGIGVHAYFIRHAELEELSAWLIASVGLFFSKDKITQK